MLARGFRNIPKSSKRYQSIASGVWSDFSNRSEALKIADEDIRQGILNPINPNRGPASIIKEEARMKYHSPIGIDETFAFAYNYLQNESEKLYQKIEDLRQVNPKTEIIDEKIEILLKKAETFNPEVLYNTTFLSTETLDRSQPVYRSLLKKKWQNHDLMVTMQRLEQLHVLPDTLPTFEPEADVKIKFPHNTDPKLVNWITPGTILSTISVSKPPTIKIDHFDSPGQNLYSVILINPDTPDLQKNSFSTTLHYGLANIDLSLSDNIIDTKKLLELNPENIIKDYLPLTPEVNAQNQRACLWVFKQSKPIEIADVSRENFDIRQFAEDHQLTPIGAHVWRQHFDTTTNTVRDMYGLGKGTLFHRVRKNRLMAD